MAVLVTKMPGGVAQVYNPYTGKITYKCKNETAFLKLDAFDGIVKFNQKNAKAIVDGPKTSLENSVVIKENDPEYSQALKEVLRAEKQFKEEQKSQLEQEISEIASKLD